MFDDLEDMLSGGAPGAATGSQAKKSGMAPRLSKRGSNSQIVPVNDIDDL